MLRLDRFKYVVANPDKFFSGNLEISNSSFDMAKTVYFTELKQMNVSNKILYFKQTYYSEHGLCWFILDKFRYFSFEGKCYRILKCNF